MMQEKEKYMARCIRLAQMGRTSVAPNPMVGAVIVDEAGSIIGEGWHRRYGEAHAEVNAVQAVADPTRLRQSTLYVSLEPCSHYGKTPPCADLIINKGIPRVVIGCEDPFPLVSGRGIHKLAEAGVQVEVGVLEQECRELILPFATFHLRKRPYIILKWAQSADGFLDRFRTEGKPVRLSTDYTKMLVHKLRTECDAILIGSNTARLDNPVLTTRHWVGANPLRVVLGNGSKLPRTLRLFDETAPTLVHEGTLDELMDSLHARNVETLMVEGGAAVLHAFLEADLWDEAVVEHSRVQLGAGVSAPVISQNFVMREECHFGVTHVYYRHSASRIN
ncbi:MAG: bifunctional diaminohydroxyphosphoribosylaminopyrimidine deaminase/5-amino-6-(5-phosphoribosylamino)uracil reductase RibD [Prevotellaceae bacterium]|nr:bifunctional diaminohydroxyphosphoribosylaminopyrimidine deaminase/5-amino-6-(5-phosphoribosylamino)uracil reductase RibD [Prevotellaceae bacterium]